MENKIKVMVFEPLREPHIEYIKNTEKVYKNIVEGEYMVQQLDKSTVLVQNAEDKKLELVPNRYVGRDIICGTFFVAADNGEKGFASISPKQAQYYYNKLKQTEVISQQEVKEHYQYSCEGIGKKEVFINNINMRLDEFNFEKIVESYKTPEFTEAKELLKMMHQEFYDTFGTGSIDDLLDGEDLFFPIPVVMKSKKTGEYCVGLVHVDITSAGELYGVDFAFDNGIVSQDDYDKSNPMVEKKNEFGNFDYWFVADYQDDIHSTKGPVPEDVQRILNYAKNITVQVEGMNINLM